MINKIKYIYDILEKILYGKKIFSKLIGFFVPYSGTINAKVIKLSSGYAKLKMNDKKKIRNHLNCIHAIALMNFAELTSGLSLIYSLPQNSRCILKALSMEYFKKSRGNLFCECFHNISKNSDSKEYHLISKIFNKKGDLVAEATALWLIDFNIK